MSWDSIDIQWNTQWAEDKAHSTIDDLAINQRALSRKIQYNDLAYTRAKNLADLCKLPSENQQYRIITEKAFNAFALIKYILEEHDIQEVYISIYRINQPIVETIIEMVQENVIPKITFIFSNFFTNTTKSERWVHIIKDFAEQDSRCRAAFVHNHSKVALIKTRCNKHFILEGSGNMSDNARIEQYILEQNKEVYDFHKEWMEEVYDKYHSCSHE